MKIQHCVVALGVALGGCSALSDTYRVDPVSKRDHASCSSDCSIDVPPPFDLDGEPLLGETRPALAELRALSGNPARVYRNRIQAALVERSDAICEHHKALIIGGATTTNLLLGEASILFGGLGALINASEPTTKALAAAAGLATATRAQINETVYQNILATAVVKALDNTRKSMRETTLKEGESKDIDDYGPEHMLRDVGAYHRACSFMNGLTVLTAAAERVGPSQADVEARITKLKAEYDKAVAEAKEGPSANSTEANAQVEALRAALNALRLQLATAHGAPPAP